jgi:hypothetical protein
MKAAEQSSFSTVAQAAAYQLDAQLARHRATKIEKLRSPFCQYSCAAVCSGQ